MKTFMFNIDLPAELTQDFIAKIPLQRSCIDRLMEEGKVMQYSLSTDRRILWVAVAASSKRDAFAIIRSFPLIDYMKLTVHELWFHNSISNKLPQLIMN